MCECVRRHMINLNASIVMHISCKIVYTNIYYLNLILKGTLFLKCIQFLLYLFFLSHQVCKSIFVCVSLYIAQSFVSVFYHIDEEINFELNWTSCNPPCWDRCQQCWRWRSTRRHLGAWRAGSRCPRGPDARAGRGSRCQTGSWMWTGWTPKHCCPPPQRTSAEAPPRRWLVWVWDESLWRMNSMWYNYSRAILIYLLTLQPQTDIGWYFWK